MDWNRAMRRFACFAIAVFCVVPAAWSADVVVLEPSIDTLPVKPAYRTEILAIGNIAHNDSDYLSLSIRHSLSGDLNNGFKVRLDLNRSHYQYNVNALEIDGEVLTARLVAGYAMPLQYNAVLHLWGGAAYRHKEITPTNPFEASDEDWGAWVSVEYTQDFDYGGEFQALAEYETTVNYVYASAYYLHPFSFVKIGPTANYYLEGDNDYARWAAGIRAAFPISEGVELTATGAYARGGVNDFDTDSSYVEMQLRFAF